MTLAEKKAVAIDSIKQYQRVLVAFSGGIDSTLVLKLAIEALGTTNVVAVVANSELFTNSEFEKAVSLGKQLDVEVVTTQIDYLTNDEIRHNMPASWYWMKKMFYQRMNDLAGEYHADAILDGMIMDDNSDFRPGLKARDEEGAISTLQVADMYKQDVRDLAAQMGLSNWNKVASCSVSSRFPYNTVLTLEAIERVKQAEAYLRQQGFATVRVRVQEMTARIEVPSEQLAALLAEAADIDRYFRELGYQYVTLDLMGFKSGRMNDTLTKETKLALTK
ncbi:ATP-dependent sacrificial sulfur transferase LarE [Weissella muntiaci]|uniref:ATP-dependent sacrificial sulfur transferase LarE n=1 Tax=Weissella muntiaci TaxID=2508881 RepID=A0A6C2C797_9LACO|nr:ATP-dependent sacrificial sulfur transferase LarE [Weissella muntiaci]TYC49707.1 ATP-dependent sacrificial sulfur transferase LarE [Weissella muntiaci]